MSTKKHTYEQIPYFIGLDVGTNSVGWATSDTSYRIIKRRGTALWGVRSFDKAETAAERRLHRSSRRRLQRRRQRLDWLQEVFRPEIEKVDPTFFLRLQESKFLLKDKMPDEKGGNLGKHVLFSDPGYTDKDYFREYPTIYHLRHALMTQDKEFDVRLVYLAIHHIMKYRGHFLYDGELKDLNCKAVIVELSQALAALYDSSEKLDTQVDAEKNLFNYFQNPSKTNQKELFEDFFKPFVVGEDVAKKDEVKLRRDRALNIATLLVGNKANLSKIFPQTENDSQKKAEVSFKDLSEDEVRSLVADFSEDEVNLIVALYKLYNWSVLASILRDTESLSEYKMACFNAYRDDLSDLKKLLRASGDKDLYKETFHGSTVVYNKNTLEEINCPSCDVIKQRIKNRIEDGVFLKPLRSKDNGAIPYQLHLKELEQILSKASQYLPFLNECELDYKGNSTLTYADKILAMFKFRVPFYVGPLNSASQYSWFKRHCDGKIYPWNFDEVVDLKKTRKAFIERMTGLCTYLKTQALPKYSLLYTKYMALNTLNKISVEGHPISVEEKQLLFNELVCKGLTTTKTSISRVLNCDSDTLSGFEEDSLKISPNPWKHFADLLKEDDGEEIAEAIILRSALCGNDKKLLCSWIGEDYGDRFTEEQINYFAAPRFVGWGSLSKEFLTEIHAVSNRETGECKSLIEMLWDTNKNLMELMSGEFGYREAVAERLGGVSITQEAYLEEAYASPALKRSIKQALDIVDEIVKIMGYPPHRIFIEMAREDQKKGTRTSSRKARLQELYKSLKNGDLSQVGISQETKNSLQEYLNVQEDIQLRKDKVYLYLLQMGKCMYSFEPIDLDRLQDYDIDHIYPQSKVKDDSLDNKVLVKKELNREKSDKYPLDPAVREKMKLFWRFLQKRQFISSEKYERLMRSTAFSLEEQAGFINRQLVQTRQSTKLLADLLSMKFSGQSEIVYVKAPNVSAFRNSLTIPVEFERDPLSYPAAFGQSEDGMVQDPIMVKCREINWLHHAKDAYLNIVVGNVWRVKFTANPLHYLKAQEKLSTKQREKWNIRRLFEFDVVRGDETAWIAGPEGSIATVRRTMSKNNILSTRRSAPQTGELFKITIYKKSSPNGKIPIKRDIRYVSGSYGKYTGENGRYFFCVDHLKGKKRERSIEAFTALYLSEYLDNLEKYCMDILKLKNPSIVLDRISFHSLIDFNGMRLHLSGRTGSQLRYYNAVPLILDPYWHVYVKNLMYYSKYISTASDVYRKAMLDKYRVNPDENLNLYDILTNKLNQFPYVVSYAGHYRIFKERRVDFIEISLEEQIKIIIQMLKLFKNGANGIQLKELFSEKKEKAGIKFSKNITSDVCIALIHQSVTGFYEQRQDLSLGDHA